MKKTILFDLDGTLTDSGEGILKCAALGLEHFGLPVPDQETMRVFVGPPLHETFVKFGVPEDKADEAVAVYRSRYNTVGKFENTPYPGVCTLLQKLKDQGHRLLVATSKPEGLAVEIMDKFGLTPYFDRICGASLDRSRSCKEDVIGLRKFLDYHGGHSIKIISKIENIEGVNNFDEILKYSDGIMVARGDMGVEVAFERLPGIQKRFIRKCYQSGKMVITATQMLESMIHSSTPTRAEITDVANAVFDGTSAVMLSGETATGDHPALVVKVMAQIARQAETDAFDMDMYHGIKYDSDTADVTNAICDAAATTARDVHARVIIAVTRSGLTARRVSKFRPAQMIVAATPVLKTFHQLSLSWGVVPVLALNQNSTDDLFVHAIDCAKQIDIVSRGDKVVITAGVPLNVEGTTNLLKVQIVN